MVSKEVRDIVRRLAASIAERGIHVDKVLLYGSVGRDNAGRAYVGGWAADGIGGQRPLLLQIDLGG